MAKAQLLSWASQVPQGEKNFKASMGYETIVTHLDRAVNLISWLHQLTGLSNQTALIDFITAN